MCEGIIIVQSLFSYLAWKVAIRLLTLLITVLIVVLSPYIHQTVPVKGKLKTNITRVNKRLRLSVMWSNIIMFQLA